MNDLPPLPKGFTLDAQADVPPLPDGFTLDKQPAQPSVAADVAKSAGIGAAKAAIGIVGTPGDLGSLIKMGADAVGVPQGVQDAVKAAGRYVPFGGALQWPTSAEIQKAIESKTGKFYSPQTVPGEYAQSVGEFLPAAIGGGSGLARRALQVAAPAVISETAGQATKGTDLEPWARVAGGVVGGLVPAAVGRAVTPLPVSTERQQAVQNLRNEGVTDLTAGQITGSKGLQYFESERGGNRAAALMEGQGDQFTRAALRRIGENADRATPDVIDGAFNRIGNQFNQIGARNSIGADRQLANDVADAQQSYRYFANPLSKQSFNSAVDDVISVIQRNNGTIPGDQYNAMRSRLGEAARAAKQDNQLSSAFYDLQHALDDAMARSMRAAGNSADATALTEARRQYRNLLTVERAVTSGTGKENAALGIISPAALKNAEVATQGRRGYARGTGDFSELARSGNAIMSPLPNSGTAPRLSAQNLGLGMSPVPAAMGAGIGTFLGAGPIGAAIGAAVGGYAPQMLGRLAVSDMGRRYLGNQNLARTLNNAPPALQQMLVGGLLGRP